MVRVLKSAGPTFNKASREKEAFETTVSRVKSNL